MLPQHVIEEGGYRVKGRKEGEHQALLADADALVAAGAFAIVLELVTPLVAREISHRIPIPTIGIGAGLTATDKYWSHRTCSACCRGSASSM